MHGECHQTYMRHVETATSERVRQNLMDPGAWTLKNPWFADQLGDIDLAPPRPRTRHGCCDQQLIVANGFNAELVSKSVGPRRPRSSQHEVEPALEQFAHFECWSNHLVDMQDDIWIRLGETSDDFGKNPGSKRLWTSNAQFSRGRIGQELDVSYALLQLIERGDASLEQCGPVQGGLDPSRMSIKKPHAECVFKVGNDFRNGRLRNAELPSRLGHAAAADRRAKHVQVA